MKKIELSQMLKSNKYELNDCVENGACPLFGYPPVLYTPITD